MGMFLPPVAEDEVWENDPEGTQPRANITFALIGAWYRTMAAQGFLDLSYFNVNEYGLNVALPPGPLPPPSAPPSASASGTCSATWRNASACLLESFPDAAIFSGWDPLEGRAVPGPIYSWQSAIVVDPGSADYHDFLLEQLVRHVQREDAFGGIVIDRSDWCSMYRLDGGQDGTSFLPEAAAAGLGGGASSGLVAYQRITLDLRAALGPAVRARKAAAAAAAPGPTPLGDGIMLQNTLGNGRLDLFAPFDGSFSEGYGVNGVGLLGLLSPAILWTYDAGECCGSAAAAGAFLQHHLDLGVVPMAPFPGTDHALAWDAGVAAMYARYGALFGALRGRVWALQPHILTPPSPAPAQGGAARVNAFVVPLAAAPALVLVVALAQNGTAWASVNVTAWERVWEEQDRHPLLRGGSSSGSGSAGAVQTYALETLAPGAGGAWQPLAALPTLACGAGGAPCSAVLPVPLTEGCALVRVRLA